MAIVVLGWRVPTRRCNIFLVRVVVEIMSSMPRDCEHGQLARSCEICELKRELTEARKELAAINANSESGETKCYDSDGCPTENAVLRREWRKLTAELAAINAAEFPECPSPEHAQRIVFEGCDSVVIAPEDYDALRTYAQRVTAELAAIREALAGADYASLPNDFPTVRMAHTIRHERDKFMDQVRHTCTRAEKAEAEREALRMRMLGFRDIVLNERGALAENGMTNDQINDVLSEFDAAIDAAAEGKK